MSLLVSGNFSSGLPVFSATSGCSFSSLVVRCELATRATLLALTALVLVSSFSIAFAGSFLATAVADSAGSATEGALEVGLEGDLGVAVEGMLGLEMLGALPVPWTGGILVVLGSLIAYGEEDSCVVERESWTGRMVYQETQYSQCKQPYGADTYIHICTWQSDASFTYPRSRPRTFAAFPVSRMRDEHRVFRAAGGMGSLRVWRESTSAPATHLDQK
jgi:hypothetical protein